MAKGAKSTEKLIISYLKAASYSLHTMFTVMMYIYIVVFNRVCLADKKINNFTFLDVKIIL